MRSGEDERTTTWEIYRNREREREWFRKSIIKNTTQKNKYKIK